MKTERTANGINFAFATTRDARDMVRPWIVVHSEYDCVDRVVVDEFETNFQSQTENKSQNLIEFIG